MSEHQYPCRYPPGTDWATDAAWEILDRLRPGVISDEVRAYLAGAIAGRLTIERGASQNTPAKTQISDGTQ